MLSSVMSKILTMSKDVLKIQQWLLNYQFMLKFSKYLIKRFSENYKMIMIFYAVKVKVIKT